MNLVQLFLRRKAFFRVISCMNSATYRYATYRSVSIQNYRNIDMFMLLSSSIIQWNLPNYAGSELIIFLWNLGGQNSRVLKTSMC